MKNLNSISYELIFRNRIVSQLFYGPYSLYNYYRYNSYVGIQNLYQTLWMHKIQIAEQSINPYPNSNANNSQISVNNMNANKKSKPRDKEKDPQNYKQNLSKHLNSIKPYIANPTNLNKEKERERKISKRQSQKYISSLAPYQPSNNETTNLASISSGKIKNKKNSEKHYEQNSGLLTKPKNIEDLFNELVTIKGQYKSLKNSYNNLVKQNSDLTQRAQRLEREMSPGKQGPGAAIGYEYSQLEKKYKQVQNESERYKNNIVFLQSQNDRIKKQSLRMIENEKFRNKKLQETLQQKQLMIAYLRSQLSVLNGQTSLSVNGNGNGFFFQNTAPTYLKPNLNMHEIKGKVKLENNGSFQHSSEQNLQNISSINIIDHKKKQHGKLDQIVPSYKFNRNSINQSLMSQSNNLMEEIIDLPRQININKKSIVYAPKINPSNQAHLNNQNKRQYIFSNEEDSLSFSYEKSRSKESISMSIDQVYQQYEQKKQEIDYDKLSINSINEHPSILTFTKKDVYILSDQQISKQKQNQDQIKKNNRPKPRKQKRIKEASMQREQNRKKNDRGDRKIEGKEHKNSILVSQKSYINASVMGNNNMLKSQKVVEGQSLKKKSSKREFENEQWEQSYSNEQQEIESQENDTSNNQTHTNTNQEKSNYTGEQQLLTFQNRRQYIAPSHHTNTGPIINPLLKGRLQARKKMAKQKVKQKQTNGAASTGQTKQKKQMPSKSKLLTKRLEINTGENDLANHEGKDSSAETRKRPHHKEKQASNSSKTGKKKLSRKRKSQQFGSMSRK